MSATFALVDVFADEPLTGNPLAVVADADGFDERTMSRVAREFNQSETTFLQRPTLPGAGHRLRSFTPGGVEVVGVGHNALGAWWWLADSGRIAPGTHVQQIGGAVLPVEITAGSDGRPDRVAMAQGTPVFGECWTDRPALAAALGVAVDDLTPAGGACPRAQVVSTGAPHLLVPARGRAAVDAARPDAPRLAALLRAAGAQGCYLFALRGPAAATARFFNPAVGLWEDPATGSAAGPLAVLLGASGAAEPGSVVVVEQGHAVGRPSRVEVRLLEGGGVELTAHCVVVAEGTLSV